MFAVLTDEIGKRAQEMDKCTAPPKRAPTPLTPQGCWHDPVGMVQQPNKSDAMHWTGQISGEKEVCKEKEVGNENEKETKKKNTKMKNTLAAGVCSMF